MRQHCLGHPLSPRLWGASTQSQPPPGHPGSWVPHPAPHSLPHACRPHPSAAAPPLPSPPLQAPPTGCCPHSPPCSAPASPVLLLSQRPALCQEHSVPTSSYAVTYPGSLLAPPAHPMPPPSLEARPPAHKHQAPRCRPWLCSGPRECVGTKVQFLARQQSWPQQPGGDPGARCPQLTAPDTAREALSPPRAPAQPDCPIHREPPALHLAATQAPLWKGR